MYDHNHCYKDANLPIKYQGYTEAPIIIGKHCWIASNVVILKGVTIGDNCVIGAGCVVYKDVPEVVKMIPKAWFVVVGNGEQTKAISEGVTTSIEINFFELTSIPNYIKED